MNTKEQAELLRRGVLLGMFRVSDVMAWCDAVVMGQPWPDDAIIEACLMGSRGAYAVGGALAQVEGEYEEERVLDALFRVMLEVLTQTPEEAITVSVWLRRAANNGWTLSEEAEREMINLHEYLALATEGVYGNVEDTVNDVQDFLRCHMTLAEDEQLVPFEMP